METREQGLLERRGQGSVERLEQGLRKTVRIQIFLVWLKVVQAEG